jgi:hypothetical protein
LADAIAVTLSNAARTRTTMVLLIGALSVSSAIFLVLELNRPLDGSIKVPDAPLRKVLEFIGK